VTEVGTLLREAGFDDDLIAAGLLHDSVERGTLSEGELRAEIGDEIADVVMTLTEDAAIEDLGERKRALRDRVAEAGGRALTVFAADKLSGVLALRRAGTGPAGVPLHYRESAVMIEAAGGPGSAFLPVLRAELELLGDDVAPGAEWPPEQRAQLTG
jgi:hypothetical protein